MLSLLALLERFAAWSTTPQTFVVGPVSEVQLQLTPAGQPRLLAVSLTSGYAGRLLQTYQYAECDADCLNAQNWRTADITATQNGYIPDSRDMTRRSFVLDHAGRPRFVFYDFGSGDYPNEPRAAFITSVTPSAPTRATGRVCASPTSIPKMNHVPNWSFRRS